MATKTELGFSPLTGRVYWGRSNGDHWLSKEEKERRRSDPRWCSCCLRRRVNKGYSVCLRCEITRRPTTDTEREG